jgi:hypothetical protein
LISLQFASAFFLFVKLLMKTMACERIAVNMTEDIIRETFSPDARVRRRAVRDLCPCHVQRDVEEIWQRLLSMTQDPDDDVRYAVMHTLCDGSPASREAQVVSALESMYNDPYEKLRRKVRHAVMSYRRTGKWNVL